MTTQDKKPPADGGRSIARARAAERLAAALRENLKRRKALLRARDPDAAAQTPQKDE